MSSGLAPEHLVSSDDVEAANAFDWRGYPIQSEIGLALSGGGFRAMLFHAGALVRLNELGLLSKVKRIASVSGGSLAAGILASQWPHYGAPDTAGTLPEFASIFLPKVLDFARNRLDVLDIATGLLPFTTAADEIRKSYETLLFGDATLADLPADPEFVFCATNLSTGVLWRFTRAYAGDYITGYIPAPAIKLATAVAASAAFPPFLSPLILEVEPADFRSWPATPGQKVIDPSPFRQKITLCDGGVYDNHGIEPIVKRFVTNFVSDGGAPFERLPTQHTDWISQLRRIVGIEDSQVRALRRRDLINRFSMGRALVVGGQLTEDKIALGARFGAYWGIDTDPTNMPLANGLSLPGSEIDQLAHLPTRLSDLGQSMSAALVNWGYAIADRSIRTHYCGPVALADRPPSLPI